MIITEGYSKTDFSQMMFDITTVTGKKNVLDVFSSLKIYPDFTQIIVDKDGDVIDKNALLKYIFLVYDRESPVVKQNDNLIKRKLEAAQMAGFPTESEGFFAPGVDAAMKGLNSAVNAMIIRFCRMHSGALYSALVTVNEAYYYKLQLTLTPSEEHKTKSEIELEKIKGDLWRQALVMMKDIAELTKDLLAQDNSPYLKKDLFCLIDKETLELNLTPERIAIRGKVEA